MVLSKARGYDKQFWAINEDGDEGAKVAGRPGLSVLASQTQNQQDKPSQPVQMLAPAAAAPPVLAKENLLKAPVEAASTKVWIENQPSSFLMIPLLIARDVSFRVLIVGGGSWKSIRICSSLSSRVGRKGKR
jgi:hypothetical protein